MCTFKKTFLTIIPFCAFALSLFYVSILTLRENGRNNSRQCWELLRPFARSLKLNGLKTQDIYCEQSLFFFRFSESNARAGSGVAARRAKRPVSRHQSRAWPFACLAGFARRTREKRETARSLHKTSCELP